MVCLTDFEEYAKEHLSKATWDYYAAGADECCTRDDNLLAYKRYGGKSLPRHSRSSHVHNLTVSIVFEYLKTLFLILSVPNGAESTHTNF